jgi:hypothetical protein
MATNKELLEARKKIGKLTPSDDPASEYQVTLALIKAAEAERKRKEKQEYFAKLAVETQTRLEQQNKKD